MIRFLIDWITKSTDLIYERSMVLSDTDFGF